MPRFHRPHAPLVSLVALAALTLFGSNQTHAQDGYVFTTLAGKSGLAGSADGIGSSVRFRSPRGIAVDLSGVLFVVDSGNATIRRIDGTTVRTIAGTSGSFGNVDGSASAARFGRGISLPPELIAILGNIFGPCGVAITPGGLLVVADSAGATVRSIDANGAVGTIAGVTPPNFVVNPLAPFANLPPMPSSHDGTGAGAGFSYPFGVAIAADGTIFISDPSANIIRKMVGNVVTTYAGVKNTANNADGPRLGATFNSPGGLTVDNAGNVFVVDTNNCTIRKISADGIVTTIAGSPNQGGSADGFGPDARFGQFSAPVVGPTALMNTQGLPGIAIDNTGNLFVADMDNSTIRKITPAGMVTTIAGLAGLVGSADGNGAAARFAYPNGIAVDGAGNLYIADTFNHTIRKGTAQYVPRISSQPKNQSVNPGQSVTLTVAATGTPAPTVQWTKNSMPLPGATGSTLTLSNAQPGDGGSYAAVATNELGAITSDIAMLTVSAPGIITVQPVDQTVLGGQALTLSVTAMAIPVSTFQWQKNGIDVVGATQATFTIASMQTGDAGRYAVVVTNATGSVTSNAATVVVNTSRIINLSIRSTLSSSAPLLTVGFVVSGNGKTLLVRGVGPTLGLFGVPGILADPKVTLFAGTTAIAANDNWGNAANATQVGGMAGQVGAFPLNNGSADAALLSTLDNGGYSAQISGPVDSSGIFLVELYDTAPTSAARLVNVSARAQIGTGDNILVAGFVITGNTKKTLLIRAVGPTLAAFGVPGTLADPKLDVIRSGASTALATNDNWGGTAALSAAFAAQGAFALSSPSSKDAALLVSLDPGAYSVQVSGVGGTTGEALVELYEVPDREVPDREVP